MSAPFSFILPPELEATAPPERRGLARDGARLLVLDRRSHRAQHDRFDNIGTYLRPGDLLVFNSSRTLPASVPTSASRSRGHSATSVTGVAHTRQSAL